MTLDNATRMLAQHPGQRLQAIVQGQQLGNQRRNQDMEGAMNALGMLLKTWEAKKGRDYQNKRNEKTDAFAERELTLKETESAAGLAEKEQRLAAFLEEQKRAATMDEKQWGAYLEKHGWDKERFEVAKRGDEQEIDFKSRDQAYLEEVLRPEQLEAMKAGTAATKAGTELTREQTQDIGKNAADRAARTGIAQAQVDLGNKAQDQAALEWNESKPLRDAQIGESMARTVQLVASGNLQAAQASAMEIEKSMLATQAWEESVTGATDWVQSMQKNWSAIQLKGAGGDTGGIIGEGAQPALLNAGAEAQRRTAILDDVLLGLTNKDYESEQGGRFKAMPLIWAQFKYATLVSAGGRLDTPGAAPGGGGGGNAYLNALDE